MAEAPRNQLPSGYDEDFVNVVEDDFECLICHLPLKEPVQTRCGHRFCKECLELHFKRCGFISTRIVGFNRLSRGRPLTCPADRNGLKRDTDVFPDKATERKILSLAIKCPSEGCDWTGELRSKEIHLASCLFKLVSCTNENCHVTAPRKYLKQHVTIKCQWRIIKCKHCGEPQPHCQMQDHIAQCSKFPVSCPNNCGASIPRELIPNHIKDDCPLTIISCPYVQMGCQKKVQRKQVESHLQSAMKLHLDLACVKLNDTQEELETTRKVVEKLDTGMFIWKINNFSEILRQAKAEEKNKIESDSFYTATYGYKLKVNINPNGDQSGKNTHLSVYIYVMKGEFDAILPWPFKTKVKFTMIDQQEDPVKRENVTMLLIPGTDALECFVRPTKEEDTSGRGFAKFISHEKLHSRRYLVDDTLFLQVEVGPSSS